jgi:hypothetical protein
LHAKPERCLPVDPAVCGHSTRLLFSSRASMRPHRTASSPEVKPTPRNGLSLAHSSGRCFQRLPRRGQRSRPAPSVSCTAAFRPVRPEPPLPVRAGQPGGESTTHARCPIPTAHPRPSPAAAPRPGSHPKGS